MYRFFAAAREIDGCGPMKADDERARSRMNRAERRAAAREQGRTPQGAMGMSCW